MVSLCNVCKQNIHVNTGIYCDCCKHGIHKKSEYFSLIHYNCRNILKNFNMLKDHVTTLDVMFDVIALSEAWLNDNSSDTVNLDGYDFVLCPRSSKKGGGVQKKFITTQIPPPSVKKY